MATPLGPGPEFDIVRRLLKQWGARGQDVGDDGVVVPVGPGLNLVVSVDASVENVHFRREWLSARETAYRATIAAASDLAAMAAEPLGILTAIVLPDGWRESVDELGAGIAEAAATVNADILGGDLSRGAALSIVVTVIGSVGEPLRRAGAQAGDHVYVTGRLGGPAAAVRAWSANRTPSEAQRHRFARPVARIREARWLAARGATAGIDVSDGLVSDLAHVAAASGVRVAVDLECVPTLDGSALEAVAGGEEYEIAVTCPFALDVAEFVSRFGVALTSIGRVVDGPPGVDLFERGSRVDPPSGYDHFSR